MNGSDSFHRRSHEYDEALLLRLSALPHRPVPRDFVRLTTQRFEKAQAIRHQKRLTLLTLLVFALTSLLSWMMILDIFGIRVAVVSSLTKGAAVIECLMTMWSTLPIYSTCFGIVLFSLLFLFSGLITKLDKTPARVK